MSLRTVLLASFLLTIGSQPCFSAVRNFPLVGKTPVFCRVEGGDITAESLNRLLTRCPSLTLIGSRIGGHWSGPSPKSVALRFHCQSCTFTEDVSIVDNRVDTQIDFDHVTFVGLLFISNSDLSHALSCAIATLKQKCVSKQLDFITVSIYYKPLFIHPSSQQAVCSAHRLTYRVLTSGPP